MSLLHIYLITIIPLFLGSWLLFRKYLNVEYQRNESLSVMPSTIQAALFFIWGGYPVVYLKVDWPITYVNPFNRAAGQIGLTIGLAILIGGMLILGIQRSLGMNKPGLILTGLYRFSRNPQILGCYLYVASFVVLWPSWYAAGWGTGLLITLHQMVLTEEAHLLNIYGEKYEDFCRRIPRYLGICQRI